MRVAIANGWKATAAGAVLLAAVAVAAPASSAELLFTLDTGADVLSFVVEETPAPPITTDDYFALSNVAATLNGAVVELELVQFWTTEWSSRGGFDARLVGGSTFYANGPQLYSGTTDAPSFVRGTFVTSGGSLAITPTTSVPEPAGWAMMLLGFGIAGYAVRRRSVASGLSA